MEHWIDFRNKHHIIMYVSKEESVGKTSSAENNLGVGGGGWEKDCTEADGYRSFYKGLSGK